MKSNETGYRSSATAGFQQGTGKINTYHGDAEALRMHGEKSQSPETLRKGGLRGTEGGRWRR